MTFFGNIRIGYRLGAGFLLVVAAFAGVAWFQVTAMDRLGVLAGELDARAAQVQTLAEARAHFEALTALVADAVVNRDLARVNKDLVSHRRQGEADMSLLNGLADTDLERREAAKFRQAYETYLRLLGERLLPLLEARTEGLDAAVAEVDRETDQVRDAGLNALNLLLTSLAGERKAAAEEFVRVHGQSVFLARWLSLAGVLLAVGLAVGITLGITRPLRKAAAFAQAVARGDLERSLDVRQDDETGRTCAAVAAIAAGLKDVLAEFDAVVRDVETGRLDRRSDAARFSGAFGRLVGGADRLASVLTGFLEAMPLPVLTLDRQFNILYMNAAGRGLANKDLAALKAMKCHELFQTGDCKTPDCACGRAMDQGRLSSSETVARGTGQDLDIQYSGVPITDSEGAVVGALEVITDLTAVRTAQRKMEDLAGQSVRIAESLGAAAEELAAQVEQSDKGARVQRERATETAAAMEQMNASVREVARNAGEAAGSAEAARSRAEEGSRVVAQSVTAIGEVRQAAGQLSGIMSQLGQQVEGIGRIMDVITDIADQTNLLALNAAIEAARAGDAGRGFAVVADEVRKLAEKTVRATNEVGQAIAGIQEMTGRSLAAATQAEEAVGRGHGLVQDSGAALGEIVRMSEETSDQVRAIASASEEQSTAVEQITRAAEEVNQVAAETSQAMSESARAIADLARLAQELRKLIDQMRA